MIQLIFLIWGLFVLKRHRALCKLRPDMYPEVDPAAFAVWHRMERSASHWLLWATLGSTLVQLAVLGSLLAATILFHLAGRKQEAALGFCIILCFAQLIICLIIAAIRGSQARPLRRLTGIRWPDPNLDARINPLVCPHCAYNRAGLPPNSPCPECGQPPSLTQQEKVTPPT